MYLPLFPFTRAMSQSPCLHEVLTTATIMSKFCEEYVISLSRYCGKTLRQMNMGFFKARYVRDYVAAAKLKAAVIWAAEIAAVLILGIVLAVGYGKITVMQEGSMDPTLNAGDVLLVDRMAYRFSTPKRGDIIVYKTGDDKKASTHIKRIIGLPGETIQIKDGQILIDGETIRKTANFQGLKMQGLLRRRWHWTAESILCWVITGTTVKTADTPIWEMSRKEISSVRSGLLRHRGAGSDSYRMR